MARLSPPLVCPVCRRRESGGRTFALSWSAHALTCPNEACNRAYPVVDGVPVVHPRAAELVKEPGADASASSPDEEVRLAGEDARLQEAVEHLSTYLDASWGDRAEPSPQGLARRGGGAVWERLAARADRPVERAIDLGTSVGRGVFELARGAKSAVGIDVRLMSLRRARRILEGDRVPYARHVVGPHYEAAVVSGEPSHARLVCGDALDPPFSPASFDRVAAINLLDAVARPQQIVLVVDGLCAPGGEIIVASPFAWSRELTPEGAQRGGRDPAAWLRHTFVEGVGLTSRYVVEDEAELEWCLRHSARSTTVYGVYYLRARKLA